MSVVNGHLQGLSRLLIRGEVAWSGAQKRFRKILAKVRSFGHTPISGIHQLHHATCARQNQQASFLEERASVTVPSPMVDPNLQGGRLYAEHIFESANCGLHCCVFRSCLKAPATSHDQNSSQLMSNKAQVKVQYGHASSLQGDAKKV